MSDLYHQAYREGWKDAERAMEEKARKAKSVAEPWPMAPLTQPAPEIIMEASGFYWRRYGDNVSMPPTTDSNDPTLTPFAVYRYVGWEDHDGTFHTAHTEAIRAKKESA